MVSRREVLVGLRQPEINIQILHTIPIIAITVAGHACPIVTAISVAPCMGKGGNGTEKRLFSGVGWGAGRLAYI